MRNKIVKKYFSLCLILMLVLGSVTFPAAGTVVKADHIIISQVYGGGGNSGANYKNDFIELYNPTALTVDLTGWSVQYASSTGSSYTVTALSGNIGAGEYYLVQEAAGSGGVADLPAPNVIGTIPMGGTGGKVALASISTAISGKADASVVDFVGFGTTANEFEGPDPTTPTRAPAPSNTTSVIREIDGVDSNNNYADFVADTANPRTGYVAPVTNCKLPKVDISAGMVLSGTTIKFASATRNSVIEYNTESADSSNWTVGSTATISADATYFVRATREGFDDSDVAIFTYTLDQSVPVSIFDAKEAAVNTENLKVQGVVTYIDGKNVYIQDGSGAICLYLNATPTSALKVGDNVVALGKRAIYNNLIELTNVNQAGMIIVSSGNETPLSAGVSIASIIETPVDRTIGYTHMCEIATITGATLTDLTTLSQDGSDLTISPALSLGNFPGVLSGDVVNATVRVYGTATKAQAAIISMTKAGDGNNLYITATPVSSSVANNTVVTINKNNVDANIYYTLDESVPTAESSLYVDGITITGNIGDVVTLKAIAIADGKNSSAVLSAAYTIKDPNAVMNIKEVLVLPSGTADVNVSGTLVYFATGGSKPVIQSVIDGTTYSLYVYGGVPAGAKLGDEIKFKGTYTIYNGLPELSPVLSSEIISSGEPMAAQVVTIADLNANGLTMLGKFVKIQNVTLGAYSTGSTPITDATGTINIYQATPFPTQVVAGDVVDVYLMVSCYKTTVQLSIGTKDANGFNVYDVVNDTKNPVLTLKESYLDAKPSQDYTVSVNAADNKGLSTVKITYTIGDQTVSDQLMTYDDATMDYKFIIPGNQILTTTESFKFMVTATDVSDLQSVTPEKTINIINAPQILSVLPVRGGSTGDNKSPVISISLDNAGPNPEVKLTLKKDNVIVIDNQDMTTRDAALSYNYETTALTDGLYSATIVVTRDDSKSSTVTWTFTVGTPKFTAYFGQLHAHTAQYSDGSGTLADGLNYIASILSSDNVDFVSFTDHSNYFDTTGAANPAGALNDKALMTAASATTWGTYVSDMAAFNESHAGSVVAMPGFEMTWSGGPGHINTFNSLGVVSRNNTTLNTKTGDAGMKAYYDTLIQNTDPLANLSQFNHPGSTFGTFSDFAYWSPSYDNKMVAIEVGNGEGAIGSGGYFPSFSEYTKALDKGWHVAPTNNQDNHKGRWGNANTARTVIISDELSNTGLLKGMQKMSVYSTEDKNLNVNFTVNDQMMGSVISEVPTQALQFNVSVNDTDSDDTIAKIEIITNSGRVAASKTFASNVAEWSFEMPSIQGYYYVRVTEADKNIAVTAPVWIGQAPLVGISSLETATKMPVTNEAVNFTSTLFNNESSAVTLKSITYTSGDKVLATESFDAKDIASTGTFKHTYAYTPTNPGSMTVTATAVILVNGQEKTFTQELTIKVRDSKKLVYVGIDASHFNEYVNGNYKDSMGNFANMAVDAEVRVVELTTSEALIAATQNPKYAMLILTPPTRRSGNYFLMGYKSYSDEEIAAIKAFAEAGKTVVVTGWGDYYENYTQYTDKTAHTLPVTEHMAAQQNKLLAALGATLRVSDDEVKDDVKNGGSAQRLYLNNYNLENIFVKNVKPVEQVYSCYGGSTIYATDASGAPIATLPASVSPMVYAFETSYSADDDKDGTAGVDIPKYDNKYMVAASETVTYANGKSGTVIVAGSAFMSNFEVQVSMDSYATPAYSNYTILETLVSSLNPTVITDIATVQAASEGESFSIRGIVTSSASGYDKDRAFFDCIYLQDGTAGINAFPVSGNIKAGQTVEIKGVTSSYNGERQIAVEKITIIDESVQALPTPIVETTAEAASGSHLGSLVKVSGTITDIQYSNNVVESIFVKDKSKTICRVFIDGYITKNATIANLTVGATITATGLSSVDTEGNRIRIRDRADIICEAATNNGNHGNGNNGIGNTGNNGKKPVETVIIDPNAVPLAPAQFSDTTGHWAEREINALMQLGFVKGKSGNQFSPNATITRAEFGTILARMLELTSSKQGHFIDVTSDSWFFDSITAVFENGIVKGTSSTQYGPNLNISRQDLSVMIVRAYAFKTGKNIEVSLNELFKDDPSIAAYARDAVYQARFISIVGGYPDGSFKPQGNATRAEAVKMLKFLYDAMNK